MVPSPLKLARLALLILTLAALLHVSLWYARLLHQAHFPKASKGSASAVRRILERLRAAQERGAQAAQGEFGVGGPTVRAGAAAVAGGSRWGKWGRGAAQQVPLDSGEKHAVGADGMLETNPAAGHPIYQLVADAKKRWDDKLAKASRSLPHAVGEYRRRYGRDPPAGFEAWWAYVKQKNVQLPDEYDQIVRTPPAPLRPSQRRYVKHH